MKNAVLVAAVAVLVLGLVGRTEAARHGGHRSHVGRTGVGRVSGYGRGLVKSHTPRPASQTRYGRVRGHAPRPVSRPRYARPFRSGYYYRGQQHPRWTRTYYWSRYHTTCYWDPGTSCWYYWYATLGCYYPISYITVAPPVVTADPEAVDRTAPGTDGDDPPPSLP
jgi:hypothetical protein